MPEEKAKIHVDLKQGILEIEGSEEFVAEQFKKLRNLIELPKAAAKEMLTPKTARRLRKPRKPRAKTEVPSTQNTIDTAIDLRAKGGIPSLAGFYNKTKHRTFLCQNIIFLYYLEKLKQMTNIGLNQIYTCYHKVGEEVPNNLRQTVISAGTRKGWVDISNIDDLKLSQEGEDMVRNKLMMKKVGRKPAGKKRKKEEIKG